MSLKWLGLQVERKGDAAAPTTSSLVPGLAAFAPRRTDGSITARTCRSRAHVAADTTLDRPVRCRRLWDGRDFADGPACHLVDPMQLGWVGSGNQLGQRRVRRVVVKVILVLVLLALVGL